MAVRCRAHTIDPSVEAAELIDYLSALTEAAFADLGGALTALQSDLAAASANGQTARAVVLAALGAQWIVSDFATLAPLVDWSARVRAEALDAATLEPHAALIHAAGVLALRQFDLLDMTTDADECVAIYRRHLLESTAPLSANLVVSTAEHVASWMTNTGQQATFDELATVVERYLDNAHLSPLVRARWLFWLGANQMHADLRQAAERTWARARELPQATKWPWLNFHLTRTAIRALMEDGRYVEARQQVEALKPLLDPTRSLDLADYHHLQGWLALATGDARIARQHYQLAVESARRGALPERIASMYRTGLAISLVAAGDENEAAAIVEKLEFIPGARGDALRAANLQLIRACRARRLKTDDYGERLARGMGTAREQGLLRFFRLAPLLAAQLSADALVRGIEVDFVRRAVRARRLPAPADADDSWPWAITIYGLRPFELRIDSQAIELDGKTRTRPLALLKLLVGQCGGPIAIARVMDWLWPDQDPQQARGIFDVTVNRLRAMLKHKEALQVGEGKVALAASLVWLDTRALMECVRACADTRRVTGAANRAALFQQLLNLYRQPFLGLDDEEPWTIEARRRLGELVSSSVEALARAAAAERESDEAGWIRQRAHTALGPHEPRLRLIVNR